MDRRSDTGRLNAHHRVMDGRLPGCVRLVLVRLASPLDHNARFERRWLDTHRSAAARHWNLLTDWTAEALRHRA